MSFSILPLLVLSVTVTYSCWLEIIHAAIPEVDFVAATNLTADSKVPTAKVMNGGILLYGSLKLDGRAACPPEQLLHRLSEVPCPHDHCLVTLWLRLEANKVQKMLCIPAAQKTHAQPFSISASTTNITHAAPSQAMHAVLLSATHTLPNTAAPYGSMLVWDRLLLVEGFAKQVSINMSTARQQAALPTPDSEAFPGTHAPTLEATQSPDPDSKNFNSPSSVPKVHSTELLSLNGTSTAPLPTEPLPSSFNGFLPPVRQPGIADVLGLYSGLSERVRLLIACASTALVTLCLSRVFAVPASARMPTAAAEEPLTTPRHLVSSLRDHQQADLSQHSRRSEQCTTPRKDGVEGEEEEDVSSGVSLSGHQVRRGTPGTSFSAVRPPQWKAVSAATQATRGSSGTARRSVLWGRDGHGRLARFDYEEGEEEDNEGESRSESRSVQN